MNIEENRFFKRYNLLFPLKCEKGTLFGFGSNIHSSLQTPGTVLSFKVKYADIFAIIEKRFGIEF